MQLSGGHLLSCWQQQQPETTNKTTIENSAWRIIIRVPVIPLATVPITRTPVRVLPVTLSDNRIAGLDGHRGFDGLAMDCGRIPGTSPATIDTGATACQTVTGARRRLFRRRLCNPRGPGGSLRRARSE